MSGRTCLAVMGVVAGTCFLSGCGTTQKMARPAAGVPTATIIFSRGPAIPEVGANHLSVLSRADCVEETGWGAVSPVNMFDPSRTFRVEAGRPLYFHFMSLRAIPLPGGPVVMQYTTCQNVVSFTPEAGRAYALEQATPRASECHASVEDAASGQKPSTLEVLALSEECRIYGDAVFVNGVS